MSDRIGEVWERLLNAFLGRKAAKTIDACALYWGVVAKVDGAKVDVKLDSQDIASPSGVPLYIGLPGTTVTLAGGERVLVGFRNGDPSQPYAMAFDAASTYTSIQIGAVAARKAARDGDEVVIGSFNLLMTAGVVTGAQWIPPGGTGTPVAFSINGVPAFGLGVTGYINGGSAKVTIGD